MTPARLIARSRPIALALGLAAGAPESAPPVTDAGAAIPALQRALAARPSDAATLRALACAYAVVADPRAEETFARALALSPRDAELRREHAEFLWRQQRYEEGNAEMERLLARSPEDADLRGRYGELLMEQSRFVQAASELSRACDRGGCDLDHLELWADALLETGRFSESARIWRRAIAREPGSARARFGLGRLLMLKGDPRSALPELERAARGDAGSPPIRVEYGRSLEFAGDLPGAEREYREALRLDPRFAPAHYALGTLLSRRGESAEARSEIALYGAAFEQGQERRRREGARRARLALGWTRVRSSDFEGALDAFGGLADDPEALRGQGEALLRMGRTEEARRAFERAAALAPEDLRIRWALERTRGEETGP